MVKKSIKYFVIALANLIILFFLLGIWADKLTQEFNSWIWEAELLKIVGFTLLSLMGMRLLVYYFRKKNISSYKAKIKYASMLTTIICSFLYVSYSVKIVQNRIVNASIRERVWHKIEEGNMNRIGIFVDDITYQEYNEISKFNWFPEIPESAERISFNYSFGGFIPDYSFNLDYEVPVSEKVIEINSNKGNRHKSTSVTITGNKKKITYQEGES